MSDAARLRARILELLEAEGPLTAHELGARTCGCGLHDQRVYRALDWLRLAGKVKRVAEVHGSWGSRWTLASDTRRHAPAAKPSRKVAAARPAPSRGPSAAQLEREREAAEAERADAFLRQVRDEVQGRRGP